MRLFHFVVALWTTMYTYAASASDATNSYTGRWKQVQSSGGYCATCMLSIERGQTELKVIANNGWTATVWSVQAEIPHSLPSLQGIGEWSSATGGAMAGRKFRVALTRDEGVLRMLMLFTATPGNPSPRVFAEYILAVSK
jgi:hypothetical protein